MSTICKPEEFLLEDFEKNTEAFEELLTSKGKDIKTGSPLEKALLFNIEMNRTYKKEIIPNKSNDLRKDFRRSVGVNDIIRKILFRKENPLFNKLFNHILLLMKAANVSLSDSNPKDDDANNKLIELYIALSVMGFAEDIEVDHPIKSSGGTNPDIIFSYQKTKWAIACKTLNSENLRTLESNIVKGINQIENSADADRGIVLVNMKNQIDHDKAWETQKINGIIEYSYYEENYYKKMFLQMAEEVKEKLSSIINAERMFEGSKKAVPLTLGYFSTVTGLKRNNGDNCITLFRLLHPIVLVDSDKETEEVIRLINEGMHDRR